MRIIERKWCVMHDRSIGPGGCCSGGLEKPCVCVYVDSVTVLSDLPAEPPKWDGIPAHHPKTRV